VNRITITREGKRFLVACFLIAVAAANTGNNLIYLLLSLMLSLLLLSAILLKINLKGLSLDIIQRTALFASEEASLTVAMKNGKGRVSSYSVHCIVPGARQQIYFGMVKALGNESRDVSVLFEKRGLYRYGDFRMTSGFPFVLMSRTRSLPVEGEVLVYPALCDVAGKLGPGRDDNAERLRLSDSGEEMYSLREFRNGDDWRKIHWKASSRTGELFVKEFAEYESGKVTIVLDNLLPEGGGLFEKTVSVTASFSRHYIEKGYFVRILSSRKIIPFGRGEEHLFKILDILAVIQEEEAWESPFQDTQENFFLTVLKSKKSSNPYSATGEVVYAEDI
jgi:uncharacterized protein (DUF58 family)